MVWVFLLSQILRMCKFSDAVLGSEVSTVRVCLLRGLFAAVLLYIQRNISVESLSEKLVSIFNMASMWVTSSMYALF